MFSKVSVFFATAFMLLSSSAGAQTVFAHIYQLDQFNVDSELNRLGQPTGGSISYDEKSGAVQLQVSFHIVCPVGMMCPAVMPAPLLTELPIVSRKVDGCGAVTIVARRDSRPVDGILEKITLRDYSHDVCEHVVDSLVAVTYVTQGYDRLEGREFKTRSTFKGN